MAPAAAAEKRGERHRLRCTPHRGAVDRGALRGATSRPTWARKATICQPSRDRRSRSRGASGARRLHQSGRSARQSARSRQARADQAGHHRQGHGHPASRLAVDRSPPSTARPGTTSARRRGRSPSSSPNCSIRRCVAIDFDKDGVVRDMRRRTLADGAADRAQSQRHAGARARVLAARAAHRQFRQASTARHEGPAATTSGA